MRRVGDTILKASNRSFVASASAKQVRSNSNIYPIISTASIKPDALQYTSNFRHSSSSTSPPASYLCVHVFVSVKPGTEKEFLNASLANARASSLEPGIARFDVIQQEDDPTKFVLVEVYKTNDGEQNYFVIEKKTLKAHTLVVPF